MEKKESEETLKQDNLLDIYTTYFNNMENMDGDYDFMSVANRPPRDFNRRTLHRLAPDAGMVKDFQEGIIEQFEFEYRYKQTLKYLEEKEDYFRKLTEEFKIEGKIPVLVCHEEAGDWCHRHLLKPFFKRAGASVNEFLSVEDIFE